MGKPEKISKEYRREMTVLLEKVILLAKGKSLHPDEVKELRDNPQKLNMGVKYFFFQNSLLITKACIHLFAASYANKANNLHSLAIHLRVVLECAGQIVRTIRNIANKNPIEFPILVADYRSVMSRLTPYISTTEGKKEHLYSIQDTVNKEFDALESKLNTKVSRETWRCSETVNSLEFGENWYNHISRCFVHSKIGNLKSSSYMGGVTTNNHPADIYMFAFLLDYLVHQSLVMVLYVEISESDDCLFQRIKNLLEYKKEKTAFYRKELERCNIK